jgi:hypothetical protein
MAMWARNPLMSLGLLIALVIGGAVLLPVLGVVLVVVVVFIGLALLLLLLAPWLVKLPWFRDRIRIHRSFDFGQRQADPFRQQAPRQDDDVIDVEGRELPDKE